jgi:adenylyltransferase/sulfurtransferase
VDRDFVEQSNLQRQILFDEDDVQNCLPKAIAARQKLSRINSEVKVDAVVADVNPENVVSLVSGSDLVLDGTDNLGTRYLVNDACVKLGIPWVYGAVVGTHGMCMAVIPHETPCLRCFMKELPPPGSVQTCDTVGVLSPAVSVVASLEVVEGFKLLLEKRDELFGGLLSADVWHGEVDILKMHEPDPQCPACGQERFEFLTARKGTYVTGLCGRNAVQINVRERKPVDLAALASRLSAAGNVGYNEHLLRLELGEQQLNVFPDGRAIVKGTEDHSVARSLYDRYVGS